MCRTEDLRRLSHQLPACIPSEFQNTHPGFTSKTRLPEHDFTHRKSYFEMHYVNTVDLRMREGSESKFEQFISERSSVVSRTSG